MQPSSAFTPANRFQLRAPPICRRLNRPRKNRHILTRESTAPLAIVPLAPLAGVGAFLTAVYALRAPIVSRALSWWLGARISIRQVEYRPFRPADRWSLSGVYALDKGGLPMFSLARANIGSRMLPGDGQKGRRQYTVALSDPEVVCCFDSNLTSTNWGRWSTKFRRNASVVSDSPELPANVDKNAPSPVKLDVKGGVLLSLRYAGPRAGGDRIINDVRLTELDGIGEDLLSPQSVASLIEKLCSKAIQQASWLRFDNAEVRRNARSFARNALRRDTRGVRSLARVHIRRLRQNVALADELFQLLPEMERFSETAKQSGIVLGQIEKWLKLVETPTDGERRPEPEPTADTNSPLATPPSIPSSPLSVRGYLELDESNLSR